MAVWHETIDLKDVWNHEQPWNEVRDAVIPILERSKWYNNNLYVQDLTEELKDTQDVEHFDSVWNALYDEADADRVWIATF